LVPHEAEMTTQEAADLLGVSRPYIIRRIDSGDLPSHKVGTHRRIAFADLLAFQQREQRRASNAADDLARESQAMGLY
jgi:excisionase family DNA binding protein